MAREHGIIVRAAITLCISILGAILLFPVAPVTAQQSGVGARAAIAALDKDAAHLRDLADQASHRADDWDALAKQAQAAADKTTDPVTKKSWKDGARDHAARAKEQRDEAARLTSQANEKDAQARKLEAAQPPTTTPAPPAAPPPPTPPSTTAHNALMPDIPITLDDLIGLWRDAGTGRGLAIDRSNKVDPAEANLVTVRTMVPGKDTVREWGGRFQRPDKSGGVRIAATYRPHWDEINPEIPEAIRKQIAGQLEWQLVITPPAACGVTAVGVRWFPGEVTWTTDPSGASRDGRITGQGKPIESHFTLDDELDTQAASSPVVRVLLSDKRDEAGSAHIELVPARNLVKGVLFQVEVSLPRDLAKSHGPTVDVTIKAAGGASTTLELTARASSPDSYVVTYGRGDWVTIANAGDTGRHDWLFGVIPPLNPGPRLPLSVHDGEEVSFELEGSKRTLTVFDNPDTLGVYRQRKALSRLREIYAAALILPKTSIAQRETAHRMLRVTLNGLQLLDATNVPAEVRLSSSLFYLNQDGANGLALTSNLHWLQGAKADSGRNALGIPFIAEEERVDLFGGYDPGTGLYVRGSITAGMEVWSERVQHVLLRNLAFSLYEMTVTEAGEDLVIFWTGVDRYGKEMSTSQRVLALLDLGKEFAGGILIPRAMRGAVGTMTGEVASLGEFGEALNGSLRMPRLRTTGPIRLERLHIEPSGAPGALPQSTRAKLMPAAAPALPQGQPPKRLMYDSPRVAQNKPPIGRTPPAVSCLDPTKALPKGPNDRAYPAETSFHLPPSVEDVIDLDRSHNAQRDAHSCQIAVVAEAYETKTGKRLDQHGAGKYLAEEGVWQPGGGVGMEDEKVAKLIRATGGTEFQTAMDLAQAEKMRLHGWSVKHQMQSMNGATHVWDMKKVEFDAKGRPTFVTFWDPAPGRTKRLPACDYQAMLMRSQNPDGSIKPHTQFMRWDRLP